jgi:hypothetical protein
MDTDFAALEIVIFGLFSKIRIAAFTLASKTAFFLSIDLATHNTQGQSAWSRNYLFLFLAKMLGSLSVDLGALSAPTVIIIIIKAIINSRNNENLENYPFF